jgi:hypothetical protein
VEGCNFIAVTAKQYCSSSSFVARQPADSTLLCEMVSSARPALRQMHVTDGEDLET